MLLPTKRFAAKPSPAQRQAPALPLVVLARLTRSLGVMTRAGVPLQSALQHLSASERNAATRSLLLLLARDIGEGAPLSRALRERAPLLPPYYPEVILAAEEGGSLEAMLARLASQLEQEHQLRRELLAASLYPAFVLCASLIIGLIILTCVAPAFGDIFAEFGAELPWVTRAVLGASQLLSAHLLPIAIVFILIAAAFMQAAAMPAGREALRRAALAVPGYGSFLRSCSLARVTGVLATLAGAGVPLDAALELAAGASMSAEQGGELRRCASRVREGEQISGLLSMSTRLPPLVASFVALGEESGSLDEMLHSLSTIFHDEAREMAALLKASVEPILIAGIGSVVGLLILAVYLPIFDLGRAVRM